MNVTMIEMDREQAIKRLEEYRRALRRRADTEYAAVAQGYEALAEGTPLIQYAEVIRGAPRDEKNRPKLAISRADRQQMQMSWWGEEAVFNSNIPWKSLRQLVISVPMGRRPNGPSPRGFALVPMVPPRALDAIGGTSNLRHHLVLWEVDQWADERIGARPDRDPLLLRVLHGDLCAVVAAWDLTDLERAVMAGRIER